MCEEKRKEREEGWKKEIKRARTEGRVWKVVGKERGKKKRMEHKIIWRNGKGMLKS